MMHVDTSLPCLMKTPHSQLSNDLKLTGCMVKDLKRCRVSWYGLPSPSLPTSCCLQPLPPPLHSNSKVHLCNLCNCIAPTLGLTTDQYWTCLDLVPMPRATIYIPFLHLSYLPDPFSLTITGNYSFLL